MDDDVYDIDDLIPTGGASASRSGHKGRLQPHAGPSHSRARNTTTSEDCYRVLAETFGHDQYKGKQKEICDAAVQGLDVLVIAPTGMGKSICFQVPALADKTGVTLVVSPLLALMKNQVAALRKRGVAVAALTSETSAAEKAEVVEDMSSGHPRYRLIYVTPEKLSTIEFIRILDQLYANHELNRLVVDEAHCISEWGHDFRDTYRKLGCFRERFPDVSIMALTASATDIVQDDIVQSLRMNEDNMFRIVHPFNRPNLFYEIQYRSGMNAETHYSEVLAYIENLHRRRGRPSSGIVYCRTRKTCTELADLLRRKGINAKPYHKGVSPATLDKTLKAWERGGSGEMGGNVVDVVCATIAFGMGIDKGDVRYIIHYDLPKSFEGYYQETGRAGRDGTASKCVLFYSREDAQSIKRLVSSSREKRVIAADHSNGPPPSQRSSQSLSHILNFAENTDICRHVLVCRYFGEVIDERNVETVKTYCDGMCDVCKYPEKVKKRKGELSSQEYASTQAPVLDPADDDDAPPLRRKPQGPPQRTGSFNAWTAVGKPRPFNDGTNLNGKRSTMSSSGGGPKKSKTISSTFNLASSSTLNAAMKKPFKTPFKGVSPSSSDASSVDSVISRPRSHVVSLVVDSRPPAIPAQRSALSTNHVVHEVLELSDDDTPLTSDMICEAPPLAHDESTLEAETSEKIDLDIRKRVHQTLFEALWTEFMVQPRKADMWNRLKASKLNNEKQRAVLVSCARVLEWQMLSLSTSGSGYEDRLEDTLDTVKMLKNPEAWQEDGSDDFEDARELTTTLRSEARRRR